MDGTIEANGLNGADSSIAGGSGGFIRINTRDLEGSGNLQAIGGAGAVETGAGGGGRIAIYYKSTTFWFGSLSTKGGYSSNGIGGAGTIYMKVN